MLSRKFFSGMSSHYQVTEQGNQQLLGWIAQASEPMPIKDDLLVKIFGGYVAQKQTILEELERHRQTHQEKLSTQG
ncbi:hypothetical protein SD81_039095 [Tolypothrix campylonemoides VB511288]|nr:hypothetical protein SD81_039095 [Tolypothrix campylonemoides VB511288]